MPGHMPHTTPPRQYKYGSVNNQCQSPLALALMAVLALVPHPSVMNPSRPSCVASRRKAAHGFAQQSIALIEDETDMPQDLSPSATLSQRGMTPDRQPLHPEVPIELESVLAFCVLAVYEYSQRGNIRKMQDRAGKALVSAMNMSLHCIRHDELHAEARRRAWWMTVRVDRCIDGESFILGPFADQLSSTSVHVKPLLPAVP